MNHVPFSSFYISYVTKNSKIDYLLFRHRYFTLQTRIPIWLGCFVI